MKTKRFNFRISEQDDAAIRAKAKKAGMSLTAFIVSACLNKPVVVIEDIKPLVSQVRKAGVTLNRLEVLSRQGQIRTVYLEETKEEFARIQAALTKILERNRRTDGGHTLR